MEQPTNDERQQILSAVESTKIAAKKAFADTEALFLNKLEDYGTKDLTNLHQILGRMAEKEERIKNLLKTGITKFETVADTFMDLAGYALIGYLMERSEWGNGENLLLGGGNDPDANFNNKLLVCRNEGAKQFPLPTPAKPGDCGFDLYVLEDTLVPAGSSIPTDVPTGVKVKLPKGCWALVINRSSTPRKLGIEVVPGVIDNGYTGELFACCYNRSNSDKVVEAGTRLAQFIIINSNMPTVKEVDALPETERGETGFGSSGI